MRFKINNKYVTSNNFISVVPFSTNSIYTLEVLTLGGEIIDTVTINAHAASTRDDYINTITSIMWYYEVYSEDTNVPLVKIENLSNPDAPIKTFKEFKKVHTAMRTSANYLVAFVYPRGKVRVAVCNKYSSIKETIKKFFETVSPIKSYITDGIIFSLEMNYNDVSIRTDLFENSPQAIRCAVNSLLERYNLLPARDASPVFSLLIFNEEAPYAIYRKKLHSLPVLSDLTNSVKCAMTMYRKREFYVA